MVCRVITFVDGFNVYHAINDLDKDPHTGKPLNKKHYLKWLDIWALSQALIHPKNDQLDGVFYFSAYANWIDENSQNRHKVYVKALRSTGVTTIMGKFKTKPRRCPHCKKQWQGHEEKESDVNLAIRLIQLAYKDQFDKAIIFSADTDLVPAIRSVRSAFPKKEVFVAIPKHRATYSAALKNSANGIITLREHHFENNLFGQVVTDKNGSLIHIPERYMKPIAFAQQKSLSIERLF